MFFTYKNYKLNGQTVGFLVISLILLHCATSINGRSRSFRKDAGCDDVKTSSKDTSSEEDTSAEDTTSIDTRDKSCKTVSITKMTFTIIGICYERRKKTYYMKKAKCDLESWFTEILGKEIFYGVIVTDVSESTKRGIVITYTLQLQLASTVGGLYSNKKVYRKLNHAIKQDDYIMILNKKVIDIGLSRLIDDKKISIEDKTSIEEKTSFEKKTSIEEKFSMEEESSNEEKTSIEGTISIGPRDKSCKTVSINMTITIVEVCYEQEKISYYMTKAKCDLKSWFTDNIGRTIFYGVIVTGVSESTNTRGIVISFTLQLQLDNTVDGLYGHIELKEVYKKLTTAIEYHRITILHKKVIDIDLTRLKVFAYPTCDNMDCPAGEVCRPNYEGFGDCIKDPCLTKKCTENGQCNFNLATGVAECLCKNTGKFIYSGEYCEIQTGKLALSRTNIIIICVVVGLVLLILLGLGIGFCCFCCKRRRRINSQVRQEQRCDRVIQQTAVPMTQTRCTPKKTGYDIGQYDNRGFTCDDRRQSCTA